MGIHGGKEGGNRERWHRNQNRRAFFFSPQRRSIIVKTVICIREISTQLPPVLYREGERQKQEKDMSKIATKRLMPICYRFEFRKIGSV